MNIEKILDELKSSGNYRACPKRQSSECIYDFSSNDYLGLSKYKLSDFVSEYPILFEASMTSSASRLLAGEQLHYEILEDELAKIFHRPTLLFNSGYHANTGIISAIANRDTIIIADRLVHASIIDGIILSRAKLQRFRHNDFDELEHMLSAAPIGKDIIVIVEGVYSMDGDMADIDRLISIKKSRPEIILYVDEAHSFGVNGTNGCGLVMSSTEPDMVDIIVGTFGKALASYGAFTAVSPSMKEFLINKARSFIFSTSLSPLQVIWTSIMLNRMQQLDCLRKELMKQADALYALLSRYSETPPAAVSHIQSLIIGDPKSTVELSAKLMKMGIVALPIRTPTVPAGTERIRFSLNAEYDFDCITSLEHALKCIFTH